MEKQPNILVICSDEHHRLMSGFMGHPMVKTPNLDRLAAQGTVFENAYCTSPVCTPSRMSLLTGKYVHNIGSWCIGVPLNPAEMTWARRLAQAGIPSTMYGKMDLCGSYQSGGFSDFKILDKRGAWDVYPRTAPLAARLPGYVRSDKRRHIINAGVHGALQLREKSDYKGKLGFYDDSVGFYDHDRQVTDWAKEYLRQKGHAPQKDPWCLYVGLVYPHWPFNVPQKYYTMYNPDGIELPVDCILPENTALAPQLRHLQNGQNMHDVTEQDIRRAIAVYYGMITAMDDMIGEILDELQAQGMLENTYILYTSDHGEALGEHGLFYKQSPYQASVSVPFILSGAGVPAAKRVSQPVSLIDLYHTVLDMAGLKAEADRPGQSLLAVAKGEAVPREYVFAEYHGNFMPADWYMLREQNYKYVAFSDGAPLLYNLDADPDELENLALNPQYAPVVQRMDAKLRTLLDPDAVSLRAKQDLGLIGENGEDYTQTLTVPELRKRQEAGELPFQPEFAEEYSGEMT